MLTYILSYGSSLAILFPLIVVFIRRKYLLTTELKIMIVYIISSMIIDVLATYWARVLHRQNHFILNIYAVVECVLLILMYREVLINKVVKKATLFVSTLFTLFSVVLFTDVLGFLKFNSFVNAISCLLIITCVLAYFFQLLQTLTVQKLSVTPMFWISVACLLYFSGNLFLFLYGETLLFHSSPFIKQLWLIYFLLLFIFRIFLAIGLWFSKTPLQLKSSSKSAQS